MIIRGMGKLGALTAILMAGFISGGLWFGPSNHSVEPTATGPAPTTDPTEQAAPLAPAEQDEAEAAQVRMFLQVLLVCLLDAVVLLHVMARSRWGGLRLIATIFVVMFGVSTLQAQAEALFFGVLPPRMVVSVVAMGAWLSAVVAVLGVLVVRRRSSQDTGPPSLPSRSVRWWLPRVVGLAVAYAVIYFVFGYSVAWQSVAVREFYGGGAGDGSLGSVASAQLTLMPFQVLRGLGWVALAIPMIYMLRSPWWETGLAVGLVFAVLMNAPLLLPNPWMPENIRMVHLIETASSNLLFGFLVVAVLGRQGPTGSCTVVRRAARGARRPRRTIQCE